MKKNNLILLLINILVSLGLIILLILGTENSLINLVTSFLLGILLFLLTMTFSIPFFVDKIEVLE